MTPQNLSFLCDLVYRQSGIVLSIEKTYLLQSRLMPVARALGHDGLDSLAAGLRLHPDPGVTAKIVDALTTNETSFYRDSRVFSFIRQSLLPRLIADVGRERPVRIWCAACSTGQEPYSLAMMATEALGSAATGRVEILATDLSPAVVERARSGAFSAFEIQRGLEPAAVQRFFKKEGESWRIDPALRAMLRFSVFNLLDDSRAFGRFDLILCRNVLIYFDTRTKAAILGRLASQLNDRAMLFLGGAETVLGISDKFSMEPGEPGYRKRVAGAPGFPLVLASAS